MQQFLKPAARAAQAEVIASELLEQLLVAVDNAVGAPYAGSVRARRAPAIVTNPSTRDVQRSMRDMEFLLRARSSIMRSENRTGTENGKSPCLGTQIS